MTLDDLERPNRTLAGTNRLLSAAKYRTMIRNVRYVRIFAGVPQGRGVKAHWVIYVADSFRLIRWLLLRELWRYGNKKSVPTMT